MQKSITESKARSTTVAIIWQTVRRRAGLLVLVVAASVFLVALTSLAPLVYQSLIDDCIPRKSMGLLLWYAGILMLLPILSMGVGYAKEWLVYRFANVISEELRRRAYRSCLFMEYQELEGIGYQQCIKAITRQVGQICEVFLCGEVISVINSVMQLAVAGALLAAINWTLALACVAIVPVLFLIVRKNKGMVEGLDRKLMALLRDGDNYLTQALLGMKTIRSSGGQKYEEEEFDRWLAENREVKWKILSAHELARGILPNIAQQVAFGVLLVLCAFFVWEGQMSMGSLVAGISYIPILFGSFNKLLGTSVGYAAAKNAIEDLDRILDAGQETGTMERVDGDALPLEIHGLDFSYGRDGFRLAIDRLAVEKGQMVAIVGESGNGKSALFDVLCRFYPVGGEVKVFGRDIGELDPAVLRATVRLHAQDSVLWNKTIEENILYPLRLEDKDETRYRECIRRAGLEGFLEALPEGDRTSLGDFGSQISGGERQRIALARALYSDYRILILDEPTAALDSICARRVFDTLEEEKDRGRTVIVVTHDILKAMTADWILVVRRGEIAESGSPEELLALGGHFKRLYDSFVA